MAHVSFTQLGFLVDQIQGLYWILQKTQVLAGQYPSVIKHGTPENQPIYRAFSVQTSIERGFPIAMFDSRRVYIFPSLWQKKEKLNVDLLVDLLWILIHSKDSSSM